MDTNSDAGHDENLPAEARIKSEIATKTGISESFQATSQTKIQIMKPMVPEITASPIKTVNPVL